MRKWAEFEIYSPPPHHKTTPPEIKNIPPKPKIPKFQLPLTLAGGAHYIQRDTSQPQESSNFLAGSFNNGNNVKTPIQFSRERQHQHHKR